MRHQGVPLGAAARALPWSTEAVVLVEPEADRILDASDRACRLLGYERGELVRAHVSDIHPAEMPVLVELTGLVMRWGSAWTDALSCLTKSGDVIPAQI